MKSMLAFVLGIAGLMLSAHAQEKAALPLKTALLAPAAIEAKAEMVAAPQRGMLYRVRHDGRTAYLFGTVHVGRAGFAPLGAQVERALADASRLVLEMDIRDDSPLQRALQQHGFYDDGDDIARHVSAGTLAHLQRTAARFGLAEAQVRRMKPWLAANLLLGLDLDRNGYHRQYGAEYMLLDAAPGKPLAELESADYQLSLFDSMDAAQQENYLREVLAELDDGSAMKKAGELIDAWAGGDRARIERVSLALLNETSHSAEFMQRVLLDQRNPQMAARVEQLLREEERSFVGVGMLHLFGATGLPALLRERGYEVERLY